MNAMSPNVYGHLTSTPMHACWTSCSRFRCYNHPHSDKAFKKILECSVHPKDLQWGWSHASFFHFNLNTPYKDFLYDGVFLNLWQKFGKSKNAWAWWSEVHILNLMSPIVRVEALTLLTVQIMEFPSHTHYGQLWFAYDSMIVQGNQATGTFHNRKWPVLRELISNQTFNIENRDILNLWLSHVNVPAIPD